LPKATLALRLLEAKLALVLQKALVHLLLEATLALALQKATLQEQLAESAVHPALTWVVDGSWHPWTSDSSKAVLLSQAQAAWQNLVPWALPSVLEPRWEHHLLHLQVILQKSHSLHLELPGLQHLGLDMPLQLASLQSRPGSLPSKNPAWLLAACRTNYTVSLYEGMHGVRISRI